MIDLALRTEESLQGHMRRSEFMQNLLLPVGRAHTSELGDEFPNGIFLPGDAPLFLLPSDQRPGITLELLQRIPVRRGRITRSIFGPIRIGCVMAKRRLAIDGEA